jgi:prepilin-type N-terminal cleavage/methylation domain-containing protein
MKLRQPCKKQRTEAMDARRAFTLIELLVVMAIITLIISILLPSLSKAREHAKNVKTRAMLKTVSDGLEMYRNENESDRAAKATNGYPPSAMGEDPAVEGTQNIAGANWLVRYLMGKDLAGYAPRRNVPSNLLNPGDPAEEVAWYGYDTSGRPVVDRVGPYLDGQAIKPIRTKELPQSAGNPALNANYEEQVLVDQFGYPVLYYVANATQASKTHAQIAALDYNTSAIYTMRDNALFTGQCKGSVCTVPGWNFDSADHHDLGDFGSHPSDIPTPDTITANTRTFPYIILDKSLYDASYDSTTPSKTTMVPYRKDSYLLFTAGKDGIFGTQDDVDNYK